MTDDCYFLCPQIELFLSCLFVCLFVCLSVVNFNLHYNFWTEVEPSYLASTNDILSNNVKVKDLVTLTPWLWLEHQK